ncbi:hypothetical protein GJAV_G00079340 [Gymnothorax javanicus]|nr:hypothetical protein GJAV_G00079340 [Gymnothorax javanicus]
MFFPWIKFLINRRSGILDTQMDTYFADDFTVVKERKPTMDSLVAANSKFSLDLFKKISADKKTDNIFFSSISISSALAMVYIGTRGNTARQMYEVLGFSEERESRVNPGVHQMTQQAQHPVEVLKTPHKVDDDEINAGFRDLMSELNKKGAPYALSLANRLYGEKSFDFKEKYIEDTKKFYQAELETVDFISSAEAARVNINSWVEKQTQEKIKELLAEGNVNGLTKLVLVNAVYFKGNWDGPFDEEETKEKQFKLNKNESKPVQMMHKTDHFPLAFIDEVNCRILEIPYSGGELSMLFFLPETIEDDFTGLRKLERELTWKKFIDWTQPHKLRHCEVRVALPKFKMEETYKLEEILPCMGMKDLFDLSCCDLSGMSSSEGLMLSQVIHKSFVEVNEEGTEASGATAAFVLLGCAPGAPPRRPHEFTADHPFLFFIRHNPSQSILFSGRFCSP